MTTITDENRPGGTLEVDAELVGEVLPLIEEERRPMVLNLVVDLLAPDLAQLVAHLPVEAGRRLLDWLPAEQAGEVLPMLDEQLRYALLEEVSRDRLLKMLRALPSDDTADVLAGMPLRASELLPLLPDAAELRRLMRYPEESAGGIMATELVAVEPHLTVTEATERVRHRSENVEDIYSVYVWDEERRLLGLVTLKSLLLSQETTRIESIMETDVIRVAPDVDQEEVARIMERHDLVELPVVDAAGRLLGRITIDDVVDVIRAEAEEDMQRMSGVSGDEAPTDSVLRISRGRLPWLLVGLFGAGISGMVIGAFEAAIERAVVLATFIPIVMAMAGNAGIQSSSIILQGIASGDLWSSDAPRRLAKEAAVALINGLALGLLLSLVVFVLPLEHTSLQLAMTAGLSLLVVIILATCLGAVVPLVLHRFEVDPAIATGPFITTSNDIISLSVYFLIATLIYL